MKKTFKWMSLCLLAMAMSVQNVSADRKQGISAAELPQAAQTFLSTHFKDAKIAMATTERDWLEKEFNVLFTDGTKIEFNRAGEVESIDCRTGYIPTSALPTAIVNYLDSTFPGSKVVEYDADSRGYKVKLATRKKIKFDRNFNVYKIKK